jgi:nostrin
MRLGNDFCKDLASILTERAEHELTYSKGLNKTSLRLQKLSKDFHGGLSEAWLQVSIQFDTESEMHKSFASALQEEIIKPLKILADNQNKCRKPVELRVEKVIKSLTDKKNEDYKYRSRCFQLVKEIEKSMYSLDEAQKGVSGKPPNQKEIQRLETQIVKTKEYLDKSESKYHKACAAVELARQDWQSETHKGCIQMQSIESDRISSLEQLIKKLTIQINLLSKKMNKIVQVFQNITVDVNSDIQLACKKYGTSSNEQDIYLYDVYAENTKNMMNRDRRITSLNKWADLMQLDVQSQLKASQGLEKVKSFAKDNPNFYTNNSEIDIDQKCESVHLMQLLYEASLFKIQSALADLSGQISTNKPTYKYSNLMNTTYDKQGVPITFLKLSPSFNINNNNNESSSSSNDEISAPPLPSSTTTNLTKCLSTSNTTLNYTASAAPSAPIISMPIPYHLSHYDSSSSSSSSSGYAAGECSSSTSSISPMSSSNQQHLSPVSKQKSYLLATTTSSSSMESSIAVPNNNDNNNNQPPPPYPVSSLKRNLNVNKNQTNNIENHYNNSNQSLSDGKCKYIFI